jgi:manganese-dependent inorganic pyrophosphatase
MDACRLLANLAGIDIETYGREMFKAGSNLIGKPAKDIFFQDFKKFSVNDVTIGVGQINSMSQAEIASIKDKITGFIESVVGESGIDMAFFMLTDIMAESSDVICAGKNASNLLANAFSVESTGNSLYLKGVVSRKKQLFPTIMEALQQ